MPRASFEDVARARRILLHGVTGSGKTTAAMELSAILGLPLHLADEEIGWLPAAQAQWVNRTVEEQIALARDIVDRDRWVMDSSYGSWRQIVMQRAQVIVALDYSRPLTLGRLLRRTARRIRGRETMCNGNTESWARALGPESILWWHARSFGRRRRFIRAQEAADDGVPVLSLRHPRDLDRLLAFLRSRS